MQTQGLWLALALCGTASAQTVFTNGIDVSGQAVQGVGLIEITSTNPAWAAKAPSLGQLAGVHPVTGVDLAAADLLTLRPMDLVTDSIHARTSSGLTFFDSEQRAILKIQGGGFSGNGAGLTNLSPAQIIGLGSAALVSSNYFVSTNAAQLGINANGANNGNAIGVNALGTNMGVAMGWNSRGHDVGAAVGNYALGYNRGAALGYAAYGYDYGVAVGAQANGYVFGVAVGWGANGNGEGCALGYLASGLSYGAAVGESANGSYYGAAMGRLANGSWAGASVGLCATGTAYGVAMGAHASALGFGNVALGGSDSSTTAASVPSGWADTVELGRGTASLQHGLNFHGKGIVSSNGVVVAAINTTNLMASFVPIQNDLSMGSFTSQPGE